MSTALISMTLRRAGWFPPEGGIGMEDGCLPTRLP